MSTKIKNKLNQSNQSKQSTHVRYLRKELGNGDIDSEISGKIVFCPYQ